MPTLTITDHLFFLTFENWKKNNQKKENKYEIKIENNKFLIFDTLKNTWLTRPQTKSKLFKFLLETL